MREPQPKRKVATPRNLLSIQQFAFALLLLLAFAREARAYMDPGSGTLIWQGFLATFVGGLFYVRRLVARFKRSGRESPNREADPQTPTNQSSPE
jgi:hypothetical protein